MKTESTDQDIRNLPSLSTPCKDPSLSSARNSIPFMPLLHGSLDTSGVALLLATPPPPVAAISFTIYTYRTASKHITSTTCRMGVYEEIRGISYCPPDT